MLRLVKELLQKLASNFQEETIKSLYKKERELNSVMNELTYRATLDDTKDIIINRLKNAIRKIENEECEVLEHVVKQNLKIKALKEKVEVEESDKVFLFSKAKEQLKIANDYKQVIKTQLREIS